MLDEYQQQDLAILQDPNQWPNIIIPMVFRKSPGMPDCGLLVKGLGSKLFLKNMWELKTGILRPQLEGVPTLEFDSFETMLEAGWEVD